MEFQAASDIRPIAPLGYVSTCAERLRGGPGTATADGCRPRLYFSTTADPLWERRGSAVARLQQKAEFYPFKLRFHLRGTVAGRTRDGDR